MFSGVLCLADDKRPGEFLAHPRLLDILSLGRQPDSKGVWQDEHFLLAQTLTFNTAESRHESVPWHCPQSGLVIAAWCRLDERADLARQLDIDGHGLAAMTDPMLILAAYRRWGDRCPEHLVGDFAFAIYDPQRRSLFAARDRVGAKPFYYLMAGDAFVFATTAAVFPALLRQRPGPDRQWMALFLVDRSMSFTQTAFAGVLKLPPAHALSLDAGGLRQRRYFEFVDDAPAVYRRSQPWVDAYRAALEEAVRCRLRSVYPLGTETSGGLDSSAITALAARLSPQPLEALHAFGRAALELEPAYLLETSYACGIVHNHLSTSPIDMNEDVERALAITGYPVENDAATVFEPFFRWASVFGVRTMLSGMGGDEVVTHSGKHLRRELLAARQYRALWGITPGNALSRPLRFLKWLLRPNAGGAQTTLALKSQWSAHFLQAAVVDQYDLQGAYMTLAAVDAPYRSNNDSILQFYLGPHIPSRLEACSLMALSYGVDYRWPLLDHRLMQQYLSTPSIEKAGRGVSRLLHRTALKGIVPAKVLENPSKNMGEEQAQSLASGVQRTRSRSHELLDDPHPLMAEFVDLDELRRRSANFPEGGGRMARYQFEESVRQAYWLNRWLRRFFP